MKSLILFFLLCTASSGLADHIVTTRTIRANTVIAADDLRLVKGAKNGETDIHQLIGKEARVTIYAGRPIRTSELGQPAIVERNQIVPIIFTSNGLRITTEGRSLSRAGSGEVIRVMNLQSRNTVYGKVTSGGQVIVSGVRSE